VINHVSGQVDTKRIEINMKKEWVNTEAREGKVDEFF
jgi:hypothetical protein